MPRPVLLVSAAGKVAALLLWLHGSPWPLWAGCFFLPDFFVLYGMFVPSAQGLCRVFTRFETDRQEVWLTIDDGPDAEDTPRILDLLDRHRARATFFLRGERVERFPGLAGEILRRGHEVGHHTHTHPAHSFWCASPARVRAEIDDGLAALGREGARPRWFRAPVGIKSLFLADALAARGLQCVGWSVRSLDTMIDDPGRIARRVMERVRPGSILLLHEGAGLDPRVRVAAIGRVLDGLAGRGIACVLPAEGRLRS
jgi:peptidoglycan-N-acetylglucosamine deacetylase